MEQKPDAPQWLKLVMSENGDVHAVTVTGVVLLGPRDEVCEEMCRFLAQVDFGDCGTSGGPPGSEGQPEENAVRDPSAD